MNTLLSEYVRLGLIQPRGFSSLSIDEIITQCSVCHRYRNKDTDEWYRADDIFQLLIAPHYAVSHGYCPECFKKERR
jgi:hypothetical protein